MGQRKTHSLSSFRVQYQTAQDQNSIPKVNRKNPDNITTLDERFILPSIFRRIQKDRFIISQIPNTQDQSIPPNQQYTLLNKYIQDVFAFRFVLGFDCPRLSCLLLPTSHSKKTKTPPPSISWYRSRHPHVALVSSSLSSPFTLRPCPSKLPRRAACRRINDNLR